MKETYKVKTPKRVVFGDPLYFEQFKGEKLKSLVVDFKPPRYFETRVVLESEPNEEFLEYIDNSMTLYMSLEKQLPTYLKGMHYASQQLDMKRIGVDTAEYLLQVDDREEVIHTGGDGYWGGITEFSRTIREHHSLDAVMIVMCMPEDEDMESMREYLNYLFEDVELLETTEQEVKNESTEMQL